MQAINITADDISSKDNDNIDKITKFNPFIKRYWENAQEKNIPLEEAYRNIKKALDIHSRKKKISKIDLKKAETVYEASKNDPVIKEEWEKVKNQQISLDKGYKTAIKVKEVRKSIHEEPAASFERAGKDYREKKKNLNKINNNYKTESSIKRMYICKWCTNASVKAIPVKCVECGCLNYAATVVCNVDIINGLIHNIVFSPEDYCITLI